MKTPTSWPVRVKQGNSTRIYRATNKGYEEFKVVYYDTERKRRFKSFASYQDADIHARQVNSAISRGDAATLTLTSQDRLIYLRSVEAIRPLAGVALDLAIHEYVEAKKILGGASLLEAARFFAKHRPQDLPRKTVDEAFREMLKAKKDEGLSDRYRQDLDSRLGAFSKSFGCQLSSVTGAQIKAWIQELDVENRTRNNFRLAIQTLFSFAKAQKYLHSDWNELEAVPVWKNKTETVEIFTPAEMATLLSVADAKLIPFLTIGAFAGLRSAEIQRLDYSKLNLKSGYITVDAGIAKTNSRRLVPISDNLKAWLTPYIKDRGPVVELANVPNAVQRLVEATRPEGVDAEGKRHGPAVEWRHNALRHSYCSYRLADVKSAAQVALECGNSPHMIFKHYRELVTEDDAKLWFSLTPERAANVVPMTASR